MPTRMLAGFALAALAASSIQAAALRQIEVQPPAGRRDAVLVTKVTVGGKEVQCRLLSPPGGPFFQPITPFEWGDDWLQNVDLYLFNRTSKAIEYGQLTLLFPEAQVGSGPRTIVPLDFGVVPPNDLLLNGKPFPRASASNERPIVFPPGQTLVIHLADYAGKIQMAVSQAMPNRSPTRVFVIKGMFFFSDGMRWVGIRYDSPDPEQAGAWIYEGPEYFPGDAEKNWPVPGHP